MSLSPHIAPSGFIGRPDDIWAAMQGKVRTRERCPVHGRSYAGRPMACPVSGCTEHPRAGFYLEIYFARAPGRRQRRIYSGKDGVKLDSEAQAWTLLADVNSEIKHRRFDPEQYNQNRRRKADAYALSTYAGKVVDEMERGAEREQAAPETVRKYGIYISRHIEPDEIGSMDMRDITPRVLKDFRARLLDKPAYQRQGRTLSPKTVRNLLAFLHGVLAQAAEDRLIQSVPPRPAVKVPKRKHRVMQQPDQLRVLAEVERHHAPIFWAAYYTGQRDGELAKTRVRDYNTALRQLKLRDRKADDEHVIPLPDELCAMLDRMLESRARYDVLPHPEALLFATPRGPGGSSGGRQYNTSVLSRIWHRACDRAGVPYLAPYQSTKHSLAHRMLELGYSRSAIAAFLGITERSTQHYAEFTAELLRPISERLHALPTLRLPAEQGGVSASPMDTPPSGRW